MRRLLFSFVVMIVSMQAIAGSKDSTSYYKKLVKPDYSELDFNFRDTIKNSKWKLIAEYKHKFLFFHKFKNIDYDYVVIIHDSTVTVNYGDSGSYTVNYNFDIISSDFIIFELSHGESYAYQLLRFEDGYMIVNYININRKGRLKHPENRLLFKRI